MLSLCDMDSGEGVSGERVFSNGDVTVHSDDGGAGAIETDWAGDCGEDPAKDCGLPMVDWIRSPCSG